MTPLVGGEFLLLQHSVIVPFILLHWATNQSVCALTELEKHLRGKESDKDTFIGQIVGPVYAFGGHETVLWCVMIALWLVSLFRLSTIYSSQKASSATAKEKSGI